MELFDLSPSTPVGGDGTCGYYVDLNKQCTLKELLDNILTRTNEWGEIHVIYKNKKTQISHKYGECNTSRISHLFDKEVKEVSAGGGWTRMDWRITI